MTVLPVIERELRTEARHPLTYWLRVIGATALLVAAAMFWLDSGFRGRQGAQLFKVLHQTLFWAIWLLVPLLTADCISREKREGTLGLLFLTPLRARDIVLAKGLVHGLRAMTVCLAALPVVVLPFLMGGVDWRIAVASVLVNLISFCWALGAGLLASARNKTMTGALIWSALWAFLFFWVMIWVTGLFFLTFAFSTQRSGMVIGTTLGYLASGLAAVFSFSEMWQWMLVRIAPSGQATWLNQYVSVFAVSLFSLYGLILIAASNIRRKWQDNPPSAQRLKLEKKLFTPAYGLRLFRFWMRGMLERNPIGWLERRTWSGRLVSWSWLAVMIALYSFALEDFGRGMGFRLVNTLVPWLLILSIGLSAAGSFRRERELGVMELLLVTPLRVGQIISGRLLGLWGQLLPAVLLLMGLWLYLTSGAGMGDRYRNESMEGMFLLWVLGFMFVTLPVIGLFFSLRCRNFITALFFTGLAGVVLPGGVIVVVKLFDPGNALMFLAILPIVYCVVTLVVVRIMKRSRDYRRVIALALGFGAFVVIFFVVANGLSWEGLLGEALSADGAGLVLLLPALQMAVALVLGARLHHDLVHRTFAFQA